MSVCHYTAVFIDFMYNKQEKFKNKNIKGLSISDYLMFIPLYSFSVFINVHIPAGKKELCLKFEEEKLNKAKEDDLKSIEDIFAGICGHYTA